ncbi:hypothetical protein DYB37_002818 [Aphanomyces astaci]|nr:hypothetical protein DYB35_002112 [Aphanomyces astaci]RHZ34476.1 hypothetical protein DYB37_002818 [Aphanomyces astaci]
MESKPAADATDFVLNFVGGPIKFRADEGALFAKLFHIVWRLASGGKSQDRLSKDSWFVAMKLVALVQSTGKCKMQYLYEVNPTSTLPLPDFHLEGPPDNVVPSDIDAAVLSLQEKQFKVAVSSPIVVGSSYTRFTQYVVSTTVR